MAESAASDTNKPYILIIDEINRANLAAVLGELIYALEYREEVETPYNNPERTNDNTIKIPENLYILGTMNTADRSIGHIDYAVRRRFVFIPALPCKTTLDTYSVSKNLGQKPSELFATVEKLFDPNKGCLSPDFHADDVQVGHTYFMAKDCEELAMKFAYQVYPLLREYYKDGILQDNGQGIKVELPNGIELDILEPVSANDIYVEIKKWCASDNASEKQQMNQEQGAQQDDNLNEQSAEPQSSEPQDG
jgi:hypothetical protein